MSEQHLDLLPLAAGLSVGGRVAQSSGVVASVLIEQAHDGADASAGAALPLRAAGAVGGVRSVRVDARGIAGAAVGELASSWADEQVALVIEGEGVAGQLAFGLMLALEHRHMRLDAPLHQPGQKRAGAVAAVGGQALWHQPQPVAGSLQHALGGDDLLAQAGGRGLDVEDHRLRGVDQVVGLITKAPLRRS